MTEAGTSGGAAGSGHPPAPIRLWAPFARNVDLVLGAKRVPMESHEGGWWAVETVAKDIDYAFSLDGSEPLPDPRSPRQPAGAWGASRRVGDAFPWTDAGWVAPPFEDRVIYELHVGTFTPEGTFAAAQHKLDHLVDLGVDCVELMPVNEFPGLRGWGYDGVGLYAPHHAYGQPDDLKRLVDACHARGLAVLLDVVYNHIGPSGDLLGRFGPYLADRLRTPWGDAFNLDGAGSDEVRSFLIENALMWLERYHFDGLRLDAVQALVDRSAVHLLEELAVAVEGSVAKSGRAAVLIAESDLNDPRIVRPRDRGGYGIDAQWSDDFHHAVHALLTGERNGYYQDFGGIAEVAKSLQNGYVYDGGYSRYRARRHGRSPRGLPGRSFVGYLQNHDQIGNRARGERIDAIAGIEMQQIGAALVLCSPFVPLLFMGEEWMASTPFHYFTDHGDPELGGAVAAGRKLEFEAFGWDPGDISDPQDAGTFAASKLRWDEIASEPHRTMLRWYRDLIRLRKARPELKPGRLEDVGVRYDTSAGWLVLERGPTAIACNLSDGNVIVPEIVGEVLLSSRPLDAAGGKLLLPARSVAIISP